VVSQVLQQARIKKRGATDIGEKSIGLDNAMGVRAYTVLTVQKMGGRGHKQKGNKNRLKGPHRGTGNPFRRATQNHRESLMGVSRELVYRKAITCTAMGGHPPCPLARKAVRSGDQKNKTDTWHNYVSRGAQRGPD